MPIYVTKTYLPPLEEYVRVLEGIWERGHVTNHGQLVVDLENRLAEYFGVRHVVCVTNGTVALQIGYRALELTDEVITTPFSYVATTSALVWEGCRPTFADIDAESLCLDPEATERAITDDTTGIVATHVYGNPCDVEAFAAIAKRHGLRVLYDAAHAFGVEYQGESLLTQGDAATLSFHATKLFHTVEGGALVTNDDEVARRARYLRNFGHDGPEAFFGLGINGKMSELQAGMGQVLLPRVDELIAHRRRVSERYEELLADLPLTRPVAREGTTYNYAYYPVLFSDEDQLLRAKEGLEQREIYPRRYFYPSLNRLPYVEGVACPVAEDAARRILCLPLSPELAEEEISAVATGIRTALRS